MSTWEFILFDLECDGFRPSQIFMISMVDLISRERESFVGTDAVAQAIVRLQAAKLLVGHNIKSFDCPVIERLTEGAVKFDRSRVLDTMLLSKNLVQMPNHKLETWGEVLGKPKLKSPTFRKFTPAMVPYCEGDVDLNLEVFLALWGIMMMRHANRIPPKWKMLREFREAL